MLKVICIPTLLLLLLLPFKSIAAEEQEIIDIPMIEFAATQAVVIKRFSGTKSAFGDSVSELEKLEKTKLYVRFSKDYLLGQINAETDLERAQLALNALKYYRQFGPVAIIKPISSKKGYKLLPKDHHSIQRPLFFTGDVDNQLALLFNLLENDHS